MCIHCVDIEARIARVAKSLQIRWFPSAHVINVDIQLLLQ